MSACITIQPRGTEKVISRSMQSTEAMKEIFSVTLSAVRCFAWRTALSKKTAISVLFRDILQQRHNTSRCRLELLDSLRDRLSLTISPRLRSNVIPLPLHVASSNARRAPSNHSSQPEHDRAFSRSPSTSAVTFPRIWSSHQTNQATTLGLLKSGDDGLARGNPPCLRIPRRSGCGSPPTQG